MNIFVILYVEPLRMSVFPHLSAYGPEHRQPFNGGVLNFPRPQATLPYSY
jgi:hypothetical protein